MKQNVFVKQKCPWKCPILKMAKVTKAIKNLDNQ